MKITQIASLFVLSAFLLTGCHSAAAQQTTLPTKNTQESSSATTAATEVTDPTVPTEVTVPEETIAISAESEFDPASLVDQLSVEEKVGQLFLARCPEENALEDAVAYHLGGYILFDRDFRHRSPHEVRNVIEEFQQAATIPMLIAADEEGGTVTRISCYEQYRHSNFPSPRKLYNQGGMTLIEETEREKCQLLSSLGVNVNMAPVCDITTDPDAFMYSRSLGQPPYVTAYFTKRLVEIMAEHQIGSVLKHFPGYGNNSDTHTGIAVDDRPLCDLEDADLIPFSIGIDAGCGAILISHTFINALDPALPASLSPIVNDYLRQEMGFNRVTVTDDLAMQAIAELYGTGEAAVLAILAGNDLLCSSEYQVQYYAVLAAVQSGRISEERLDRAVSRVLQWKYQLGLIEK